MNFRYTHVTGLLQKYSKGLKPEGYDEPKAMMQPSFKVLLRDDLFRVGSLLSVSVSSPCFTLLGLKARSIQGTPSQSL